MAMNRVQFQAGLSMAEFIERYGTVAKCQAALEAARWPQGFRCPRCEGTRHCVLFREGRKYFQCYGCRHQTTVLAGTLFQATKLALPKWFLAMHLMTQAKNNVSALELMRHLGVNYRSAWLVKHKLMQLMSERDEARLLDGRVEIDDAYLGGERPGKHGRGSQNKIPFVAAVQTSADGHPLYVRLTRLPAFTKEALEAWASKALASSAHVLSDGLHCFRAVAGTVATHEPINVGAGRQAVEHPEFRRVNTLLGKSQDCDHRDLSCFQVRQVCRPLPRRGAVPIQPPFRSENDPRPAAARRRKPRCPAPRRASDWLRFIPNHHEQCSIKGRSDALRKGPRP